MLPLEFRPLGGGEGGDTAWKGILQGFLVSGNLGCIPLGLFRQFLSWYIRITEHTEYQFPKEQTAILKTE